MFSPGPRRGRSGRRSGLLACGAAALIGLAALLAGPSEARAEVLVTNFDQSATDAFAGLVSGTTNYDIAQAFTTGDHAAGYTLTSIEVVVEPAISAAEIDNLDASVWTVDASGRPDTKQFDLTNPASISAATLSDQNKFTGNFAVFTPPANTELDASTTYAVVLTWGITSTGANWWGTTADEEDNTSASGWSIANVGFRKVSTTTTWNETRNSGGTTFSRLIRVNGAAKETTANNAATGAPAITGTAQVGQTLTAGQGTIADADGLPATFPDDYAFQWIQVDGGTETDISGATSQTYEPVAGDVGKTLKVKVSFTDDASNDESRTSAATAAVTAAVVTPPPQTPNAVWSADVTAGNRSNGEQVGYVAPAHPLSYSIGSITDDSFDLDGTTYTVWRVAANTSTTGTFHFTVATGDTPAVAPLPSTLLSELSLKVTANASHVDGPDVSTWPLSDATYGDGTSDAALTGYRWTDWDTASEGTSIDPDITSGSIFTIELVRSGGTSTNNAPTVANPIPDQTATPDTEFTFTVPEDAFADTDTGDTLTYSAAQDDASELPAWLTFDATTRTFSGTPAAGDTGTITVRVTASDGTAEVHDDFEIRVTPAPTTCAAASLGTRRLVKSFEITVGSATVDGRTIHGVTAAGVGGLVGDVDRASFRIRKNQPRSVNVSAIYTESAPTAGQLTFSLIDDVETEQRDALRLHVCGDSTGLAFSTATRTTTTTDVLGSTLTDYHYRWSSADLDWSGETTRTVHLSLPANRPATGEPTIATTGTGILGDELTAATTGIADDDGLPTSFEYQWVREDMDGTNREDIEGKTSGTYRLTNDDVGKRVRVRVAFEDLLGSDETRTSAAFPAIGTVAGDPALLDVRVTSTPLQDPDNTGTPDTYGAREHIEFTARFNTPVVVASGVPTFTFVIGTTDAVAHYYRGSGTDALVFSYAVRGGNAGDEDTDGITWEANKLSGTIHVEGTTDAPALTHGAQSAEPGHKVDGRDTTNRADTATVTDITVISNPKLTTDGLQNTYGAGEDIAIRVTFSEAVTVAGDPKFRFEMGDSGETAADVDADYDPGQSTSTRLVFVYTVQAGDSDDNDIAIGQYSSANPDTFQLEDDDRIRVAANNVDADLGHTRQGNQTGHRVDGSRSANSPATGAPAITGTPQVGQTLTAGIGTIADDDGLPATFPDDYAFQWIQVDGGTETDISGATSQTYEPVAGDVGKTLKVKVSFTDDAGNDESLTSAATAAVIAAVGTCPAPDYGTRRPIWTGTVTVGPYQSSGVTLAYGFLDSSATDAGTGQVGALDDTDFDIGPNGYTIDTAAVYEIGAQDGDLYFGLTSDLTAAEVDALQLHVCDTEHKFGDAIHHGSTNSYQWEPAPGLDWSGESTRTLHLSLAANNAAGGAPTISSSGAAYVGDVLTADPGGITDDDGKPSSFEYQWVREDADGTNPQDIAGETSSTYTLAAADVGKRVRVRVEFIDLLGGEEAVSSAAWPATGTVANLPTVTNCQAPDYGTRRPIWSAVLTPEQTGTQPDFWGYNPANSKGSLSPKAFSIGPTSFTFTALIAETDTKLNITLDTGLSTAQQNALRLHVCDTAFDFSDDADTSNSAIIQITTSDIDWTDGAARNVHLSLPANNAAVGTPTISSSGAALAGDVLTADSSGITDADGLPSSFTYQWYRENEDGTGREAISGATSSMYTLVTADAGKKVLVQVEFVDLLGGEESVESAAWPATGTVTGLPTITIEADRTQAPAFVGLITYTLTREGDTANQLKVNVVFTGPSGHDWGLSSGATREVTFNAGSATATLERRLTTGFFGIGFDNSATASGVLTASIEAVSGYDTTDTAEVQVDVPPTGENQFRVRFTQTAYEFVEGGGPYTITIEAAARSTDVTLPIYDFRVSVSSREGTAESADDYTALTTAPTFRSSDCASNADSLVVCTKTVTITIVDDDVVEPPENFVLRLGNAPGFNRVAQFVKPDDTLASAADYPATIRDDDNTAPTASDKTVMTDEDTAYAFAAADFNFADTDGDTLASVKITQLESAGDLELDGVDVTLNQVVLKADIDADKLTFTPAANAHGAGYATFMFRVSDGNSESASAYTMTVDVDAVNDAPTLENAIANQTATAGESFSFTVPANAFEDVDGDTLTYEAALSNDDPLPSWLSFNATSRAFSGTPGAGNTGTIAVKVTAQDGDGESASDTFDIVVAAAGTGTACPAPDFGTRRQIWTGNLTVGSVPVSVGGTEYGFSFDGGALDDTTFTIGTRVRNIASITHHLGGSRNNQLRFQVLISGGEGLSDVAVAALRLHVCNTAYDFSNAVPGTGNSIFLWNASLDWSGESTRTLYLSLPANRAATGGPGVSSDGAAVSGDTLTADPAGIADPDGLPDAFTYQWLREDADGSNPAPIAGETSDTYTLTNDDVGKRVRVRVGFTDQLGSAETLESGPWPSRGAVAEDPANPVRPNTRASGAPTITGPTGGGAPRVGDTLMADIGAVDDADGLPPQAGFGYQWVREDADGSNREDIPGANGPGYTLVPADTGKVVHVRVTFTDGGGGTETVTSAPTEPVAARAAADGALAEIVADARTVTIVWGEALDPGSVPAPGDFEVPFDFVDGSNRARTLLASLDTVRVAGSTVTLRLDNRLPHDADVRVSYTPGAAPVRYAGGGDAPGFAEAAAENRTPDIEPPKVRPWDQVTVNGATLRITFPEPLDPGSVPEPEGFDVNTSFNVHHHDGILVERVSVSGRVVTLTLARAVSGEEGVSVSYGLTGGTPIRDLAGNESWTGGRFSADNLTRSGAAQGKALTADGDTVTVVFDAALDAATAPGLHEFRVKKTSTSRHGSYGKKLRTVTTVANIRTVAVSGSTVTLTAYNPADHEMTVRLSYVPGDSPLRFSDGTAVDAFSNLPVENLTAGPAAQQMGEEEESPGEEQNSGEERNSGEEESPAEDGPPAEPAPPPIVVSVSGAQVREGPGATLDFVVSLSRPAPPGRLLLVPFRTGDGTAVSGSDYIGLSGRTYIRPGGTSTTLSIKVLDDNHDEGTETMTLTIFDPSEGRIGVGTATGTIMNSDPMPREWNVRFGRSVGTQAVDAVTGRLGGGGGTHVTLGGRALPLGRGLSGLAGEAMDAGMNAEMPDTDEPSLMTHERTGGVDQASLMTHEKTGGIDQASLMTHERTGGVDQASVLTFDKTGMGEPSILAHEKTGGVDQASLMTHEKTVPEGELEKEAGEVEKVVAEWLRSSMGEDEELVLPDLDTLMLGSSFNLSLGDRGAGPGSQREWSAWGRFARDSFEGAAEGLAVEGDVTTGFVGMDVESGSWLWGAALGISEGEGPYRMAENGSEAAATEDEPPQWGSGRMESRLTAVYPYGRYAVTDRLDLWAMGGYGQGTMSVEPAGGSALETDLGMTLGVIGARGNLKEPPPEGGIALILRADALWVRTESEALRSGTGFLSGAQADTSRLRLILEGERAYRLANGGTLTPALELGVRRDGGDAETGTGIETGARITFKRQGLTIEGAVRTLLSHEVEEYGEWGASASIRLEPGRDGRGLSFSVAPSWGATGSAAERLWGLDDTRGLAPDGEFEAGRRIDARVGYGLPVFGGRFTGTPEFGLGLSDGNREYRIGWRLSPVGGGIGPFASFGIHVEAAREVASRGESESRFGVVLEARF